jgi:hypothetical protein
MANNITYNKFGGSISGNTFSSAGSDGIGNVSVGNQDITGLTALNGYNFQQEDVAAGQYILLADGAGTITFDPFTPGGGGGIVGGYSISTFKSDLLAGALTAGQWYNIYDSFTNTPAGAERALTTIYDLFVFATGTASISQSGLRRMRVPKRSLYTANYWPFTGPSIGDRATTSNWVYENTTGSSGTLQYGTTLDTTNWDLVPIGDDTAYETRVYEVTYETNPSLSDAYFLRIMIQRDERSNIVSSNATASAYAISTSGFSLNGTQQTTCDFNEWNNPSIQNNQSYGIWSNNNFGNGTPTKIYANKVYFYYESNNITYNITEVNAEPWINSNESEYIGGNTVQLLSISDNTTERITDNFVRGSIKGNNGDHIKGNRILGKYGTLAYGILNNDCSNIINNYANSIAENAITGGFGTAHIKDNIVNGGSIESNICQMIYGNAVTGDISLNANTGVIRSNRMSGYIVGASIIGQTKAIYNNGSGIADIENNDGISIYNNG